MLPWQDLSSSAQPHGSPVSLVIRASDGRILEAAGDVAGLYGCGAEELLALTIYDLRTAANRRQAAPQMAIAEVRPIRFETTHVRRDGRTVRVHVESHGAVRSGEAVLLSTVCLVPAELPRDPEASAATGSSPWSDELALGIEDIDQQHRQICDAVALLRDGMKHRQPLHLPEVLGALRQYVTRHFAVEEAYMERHGDPGLQAHKAAHRAFGHELAAQEARLQADPSASAILALSSWLSHWIREHIRHTDMDMGRHLRAALGREPAVPRRGRRRAIGDQR